ncbi:MAG: TonB-dependent receptor plug domain-containing protein [Caenibius sp.]
MKLRYAVSALALASGIAMPAFAQDGAAGQGGGPAQGGLAEIIVTATKRSENLQNVPVAVSAISSDMLQSKGVFETSDLNASMPNLQVSSPYGQQQPNFSLRGVGVGTEYNANAASPVGVYVDEVYQAFRASHGQQLYDLEQVEVVRGPQGTLYGRNTTGGAINFITRKPKLDGTNGYLTLGYGNYDRYNAEGAVEFTPVTDKVGIRIAGTDVTPSFPPAGIRAGRLFCA